MIVSQEQIKIYDRLIKAGALTLEEMFVLIGEKKDESYIPFYPINPYPLTPYYSPYTPPFEVTVSATN